MALDPQKLAAALVKIQELEQGSLPPPKERAEFVVNREHRRMGADGGRGAPLVARFWVTAHLIYVVFRGNLLGARVGGSRPTIPWTISSACKI